MRRRIDVPLAPDEAIAGWQEREEDRTIAFAVGYLVHTQDGWHEVVRYDTVHGRLRVHRFDATGVDHASWLHVRTAVDYAAALERAIERLRRNRAFHRTRFLASRAQAVSPLPLSRK